MARNAKKSQYYCPKCDFALSLVKTIKDYRKGDPSFIEAKNDLDAIVRMYILEKVAYIISNKKNRG